jgi:hypothetical protein
MRCPVCTNRVRVLYRPYEKGLFACRHCHDLSYESRQRHRERFYEGFAKPWGRLERLAADLRSRSPSRRLRALSASGGGVLRPLEILAEGGSTKAILEATVCPVSRAQIRRDPHTIARIVGGLFSIGEGSDGARD